MANRLWPACWLAVLGVSLPVVAPASVIEVVQTSGPAGSRTETRGAALPAGRSPSVQTVTFSFTNSSDRPIERVSAVHDRTPNQGPDLVLFGQHRNISVLSLGGPIAPGFTTTMQLPATWVQDATGYSMIGMRSPAPAVGPQPLHHGPPRRPTLVLALAPDAWNSNEPFKAAFPGFSSTDVLSGASRSNDVLGSSLLGGLFGQKQNVLDRFLTSRKGLAMAKIPLDLSHHGAVSPGQLVQFDPTAQAIGSAEAVANPEPAAILVWSVLGLGGASAVSRRFRGQPRRG